MQSQLLFNQWFGKAVGAICAVIWAPADPLWLAVALILGIGMGHLYDHWAQLHYDDDQTTLSRMAQRHVSKGSPHLEYLFAGMGKIAKAGGRVEPAHIAYTERIMDQMGLQVNIRQQAKAWFSAGKSSGFPMQALSRECLQSTAQGSASRLSMLRCFCTLVAMTPSDAALSQLKLLGGYLGFAPNRIAREFGDIASRMKQQTTSQKQTPEQNRRPSALLANLQSARQLLQVSANDDFNAVKHAYRKQVSRHHPDKLPGTASAAQQQDAAAKMVALRNALELIEANQS